jgi:hexosaminidase
MSQSILLLPQPRSLSLTGGDFTLPPTSTIVLNVTRPADLFFTAQRAQAALKEAIGAVWSIAGGDVPGALKLLIDPAVRAEGYKLTIDANGITIVGGDAAGVFYGVATLIQLVQTQGANLPQLVIDDYPDFPARGVMLDISRDKVPTMETLYELIDLLASWKINQFQLYMEHTFAYRNHEIVWRKASPLTAEEILALDAYCRDRFIDLVPNQNSFGHMHRWFEHPEYLHLAETETGIVTPWGTVQEHPFSLSPAVPEGLLLIEEMFAELLPNFTSRYFNVGADETFDLGAGRSKDMVTARGKGRVYLDFLLEIYKRVKAHGRTMQFWGDIINQYPELVPEIPKDTIALEWGYEAWHPFDDMGLLFAQSGIPFYVCPGTSSWTTIGGRTDNTIGNIRSAAENGLKHGAIGLLNTDWGDLGHWQQLPISYPGYAYGAAVSWHLEGNKDIDLAGALSQYAFRDASGVMGRLAYDLGNAYQQPGVHMFNGSVLFWLYHRTIQDIQESMPGAIERAANYGHVPAHALDLLRQNAKPMSDIFENLHATVEYIDATVAPLGSAQMARPDASLIQREFEMTARMLRHGAKRGIAQIDPGAFSADELAAELDKLEADYRALWLERNRPGGLDDSAARLRLARERLNQ